VKIIVTASDADINAQVDPRFGRAKAFILYDTETDRWEALDNSQNLNAAQGAGIQAATTVVNSGAKAVLTGNCGPRAFATLSAASVAVYTGVTGTVAEAVEKFKRGELKPTDSANVDAHFGMGI